MTFFIFGSINRNWKKKKKHVEGSPGTPLIENGESNVQKIIGNIKMRI